MKKETQQQNKLKSEAIIEQHLKAGTPIDEIPIYGIFPARTERALINEEIETLGDIYKRDPDELKNWQSGWQLGKMGMSCIKEVLLKFGYLYISPDERVIINSVKKLPPSERENVSNALLRLLSKHKTDTEASRNFLKDFQELLFTNEQKD